MIINTGQRTDIPDFKKLSDMVDIHSISWRCDPIFLSERYSFDYHARAFDQIASALDGYTETAVISFIDLYPKVRRNFPEARKVTKEQRLALGKELIKIASIHGMTVKPCAEGDELAAYGADCGGCMRISDYENAIGKHLNAPSALTTIRERFLQTCADDTKAGSIRMFFCFPP